MELREWQEYWDEIERSVRNGVGQGAKRLEAAHLEPGDLLYETTHKPIGTYLYLNRERYPTWFWEWAAEALSIAVGARTANAEPQLREEDAWRLIDTLAEFANSFRHSR